jgi:hypothetical protein
MSLKPPAGSRFVEFKKLALTTATSTSCSAAWTNELAKSTIDKWLNLIKAYVPDEVRTTFDSPNRPSFRALQKPPFFPDEHGVYADLLETSSTRYIYPDCAPHQTVKYRTASHNSPTALVKQPHSPYYGIKHSTTSPYRSLFVSLVRIPIPPNLTLCARSGMM